MGERGFTLVETLVALVVLAVGLLALAALNITYVRANTFSHQLSEANVLAQDKMEQLQGYATSDRVDKYSVFDFDYLVSTSTGFTTVADSQAAGGSRAVDGLLSGSNGGAATENLDTGAKYEVMAAAACPSSAPSASDTCYTANDTIYTANVQQAGTGFSIQRTWWVQPITGPSGAVDFAWAAVDTQWTDRFAQSHSVHLESVINRRQ